MSEYWRNDRSSSRQSQPLFHQILGDAWHLLPERIREIHSTNSTAMYSGRCTVSRAKNPVARVVTAFVRFPKSGESQPITVKLSVVPSGERWVRTVSNRVFSSSLSLPTGRSKELLRERFGPVSADMALVVDQLSLRYVIRRWALLGIPLPLRLGPRIAAVESVDDEGRFRFDITIGHSCVGLLIRYAGWLQASALVA